MHDIIVLYTQPEDPETFDGDAAAESTVSPHGKAALADLVNLVGTGFTVLNATHDDA